MPARCQPPAPGAQVEAVYSSARVQAGQRYDSFRIPALARTRDGTLLAFAEGRQSEADQSGNVIVLRRLTKLAATWSDIQVVAAEPGSSLNNPCVLPTRAGRVWLMYQRYAACTNERTADAGTVGSRVCRTLVVHSDDDGATWSRAADITAAVKTAGNISDACGPGCGIELVRGRHRGRLLFPFNEGDGRHWNVFGVYSDDNGATWQRGQTAAHPRGTEPNEVQVAECDDGRVYLNARNQAADHHRLCGWSADGGATWSALELDSHLPDPVCQGSLLRLGTGGLLFANAADESLRRNGVLRISLDGGASWAERATVAPGSFGYSSLVELPGQRVGVLYETIDTGPGDRSGYVIRFRIVPLAHKKARGLDLEQLDEPALEAR